jgi:hypothetical protein
MIIKLKEMREKCDKEIAQLDRQILFQVAKKQVIDEILVDLVEQEKEDAMAMANAQEMVEEPVDNLVEEPVAQDESY